jgi:ABC-type multidrug transport system ATPase subunit
MSTERGLDVDRVEVAPYGVPLLGSTSLRMPPGSMLGVLGDAGTGKSSVLEVLAGRRAPERGTVLLDGTTPDAARVGFAEQQHYLPEGMTAAEHLALPLLARGRRPEGWTALESLLSALGLPPSTHHNLLEELSGGQQQRVAVARALVGDPSLICLDDPISELDAASALTVWSVIADAARAGAVVVVATPRLEDAERFDRTLLLG